MSHFASSECKHLVLDAEPRAAKAARAFIRESLSADDEDFLMDVVLLASELVTNAVVHARTPIEVGIACNGDDVLVAVGDRNLVRPEQQPYSIERTGGRGLAIVQCLTEAWGASAGFSPGGPYRP